MIAKQQKFIEENDIGAGSANGDKSKWFIHAYLYIVDLEMFMEGAEIEGDMEEAEEPQYISDFVAEDKTPKQLLGV